MRREFTSVDVAFPAQRIGKCAVAEGAARIPSGPHSSNSRHPSNLAFSPRFVYVSSMADVEASPAPTPPRKQHRIYKRKNGVNPRYINPDELLEKVAPKKLTRKQQHFLELYGEGKDQREAGQLSGLKSTGSIYRTLTNPLAQEYLSALRAESRAIARYDIAVAMQEANEVIEFAKKKGNAMAYCKAVELRAKLSGLLIDRVQVEKIDITKALSEAQARVVEVQPLQLPVIPPVVSEPSHNLTTSVSAQEVKEKSE